MYEFTSLPRHEQDSHITKGIRKIIDSIVIQTGCFNQSDIVNMVCEVLEKKYGGESLDEYLERAGISTTKDIKNIVESYFATSFKDGKVYVRIDKINANLDNTVNKVAAYVLA